jgi:hypothetical protein
MVTKRQLGIIVVVLALLGVVGLIGVDLIGVGEWSGFGPLQQIGVGLGGMAIVVGVILILLGNRPA